MTSESPQSPVEDRRTTLHPEGRLVLSAGASAALDGAAAQLRDYAASRTRDRALLDVLAVDLVAVADWLSRRAWLLSVDPAELQRQLPQLLDADDELLPLDAGTAVAGEGAAVPGTAQP